MGYSMGKSQLNSYVEINSKSMHMLELHIMDKQTLLLVICTKGHEKLCCHPKSKGVNTLEYTHVLQHQMLPEARKLFQKGNKNLWIFQQDGAPPHTSKGT